MRLAALESRGALFEKRRRAFLLVVRRGAEAEVGRLEPLALVQARFQPSVHSLERVPDANRRVREDLREDRFGAGDQSGGWHDLVDEADAIRLGRADHLARQNQLQRASLADQPRQTLRSAAARQQPELDLGL